MNEPKISLIVFVIILGILGFIGYTVNEYYIAKNDFKKNEVIFFSPIKITKEKCNDEEVKIKEKEIQRKGITECEKVTQFIYKKYDSYFKIEPWTAYSIKGNDEKGFYSAHTLFQVL